MLFLPHINDISLRNVFHSEINYAPLLMSLLTHTCQLIRDEERARLQTPTCPMELTNADTPSRGRAMRRASPRAEDLSNYVKSNKNKVISSAYGERGRAYPRN
jgi:hypothetical protein